MTISDLIKALHEIKDSHGDIEVELLADDGKQCMAGSIYTEKKGFDEIIVIS